MLKFAKRYKYNIIQSQQILNTINLYDERQKEAVDNLIVNQWLTAKRKRRNLQVFHYVHFNPLFRRVLFTILLPMIIIIVMIRVIELDLLLSFITHADFVGRRG